MRGDSLTFPTLFGWMAAIPDVAQPLILEVGDCVRKALVLAGIPPKHAVDLMGIDRSEFSRQLNVRGVNLARLCLLGPEFMTHFLPLLAQTMRVEVTPTSAPELARVRAEVAELRGLVENLSAERRRA